MCVSHRKDHAPSMKPMFLRMIQKNGESKCVSKENKSQYRPWERGWWGREHTSQGWEGSEYVLPLRDAETKVTIQPTSTSAQDDVKGFVAKKGLWVTVTVQGNSF